MKPDWRDRHPFKLGQRVKHYSLPDDYHLTQKVTMRGEDEYGPWIVVDEGWQRLDARHYVAEQMEAANG